MDYIQSGAACIENMLLTAHSINIGTCWVNNLPPKRLLKKMLDIPWFYEPIGLVAIGKYNQKINERKRKYNIDDLISYNKFSGQSPQRANRGYLSMYGRRIIRKIYYIMPYKTQLLKIFGKLEKKFDN